MLQAIRRLLARSKCFRPEREWPGGYRTHGTCAPSQGTHNVFIERLWRSVKYEEVYLRAYASGSEARASLTRYFAFYNATRVHQIHEYRTPDEVYFRALADSTPAAA